MRKTGSAKPFRISSLEVATAVARDAETATRAHVQDGCAGGISHRRHLFGGDYAEILEQCGSEPRLRSVPQQVDDHLGAEPVDRASFSDPIAELLTESTPPPAGLLAQQ